MKFLRIFQSNALGYLPRRFLSSSARITAHVQFPPRPTINEDDIEEKFLKGSGPGGQKINKTSSAVQLRHIPTGIVTKCQATRSREQNRTIARRNLAQRLEDREKGDQSRTAIKIETLRRKKARKERRTKRKYRELEAKSAASQQEASDAALTSEISPNIEPDTSADDRLPKP